MGILDEIQKRGNPDKSVEGREEIDELFESIQTNKIQKDRAENRRFWIATILSIVAIIVAGISLWLQVRGK
jgi:hypothetical protein